MINYFKKKRTLMLIAFLALSLSLYISTKMLDIRWGSILFGFNKAIMRFIEVYLPMDFSKLGPQLYQLWLTVVISISGAFMGMILAFFSAISISTSTGLPGPVAFFLRITASLARNIPEAVWAIILIPCLWYGEFLGFIVMTLMAYGFLTRAFADTIDETNKHCIEALKATGASYWQIIIHAVIPETMPSLISWSLYATENNIRSSTVVGMLAGGGIGYLMGIYKGYMDYQMLSTTILLVVLVVIATDHVSTQIRKRIL